MSKNYDIKHLGIISGISITIGFSIGYFTKVFRNNLKKKDKPIAKLFLHPCTHMNPPHTPPSTPRKNTRKLKKQLSSYNLEFDEDNSQNELDESAIVSSENIDNL